MQDYHNHGIDPRVLDIRNAPLLSHDTPLPSNELWFGKEQGNLDILGPGSATGTASAGQSSVVGNQGSLNFIGLAATDPKDPAGHEFISTTQDDISFRSDFAPRAPQRRSNEPWTHLQTTEDAVHEPPGPTSRDAPSEFDDCQGGRLLQPNSDQYLPESHWRGQVVLQPGKQHDPKFAPRSGLSSLFATHQEPPTVILDQQSGQLGPSAIEHQWPDPDLGQLLDGPCLLDHNDFGVAFDHPNHPFPSDPPPSIMSTDESFTGDGSFEEATTSFLNPDETSNDVRSNSKYLLQPRRRSCAGIACGFSGDSTTRDPESLTVDAPDDIPCSYKYDSRFLSPVDPRTRPEPVPQKTPHNCYKPGIASSYPPAASGNPHCGRLTANRPIAPRSSGAVTECPTPQKKASFVVHPLNIVREDGKGRTLLPPSTPKRGPQRTINHLTPDHKRRVTQHVEERFSIIDLRDLLARTSASSEIHVRQTYNRLYVLLLDEFRHCLNDKHMLDIPGPITLMDFLAGPMKTSSAWLKCIEGSHTTLGPLECFLRWNSMPSRATYNIVYPAAEPRQLDPEIEQDAVQILLASQLSRIVCRAVELTAFSWLQKELSSLGQSQKAEPRITDFVQQLGQTLLTLRWRVSWWEIIEAESNGSRDRKHGYVDRVKGICRILYVYYFIARRKLLPFRSSDLVSKNGMYSEYADAEPIFETLPHDETLQGFEQWMVEGHDMIRQASVPERIVELFPV
ncbi:MAG: hypothetical protein Q9225_005666 [Loekoesia sp. 1 TL-2023]